MALRVQAADFNSVANKPFTTATGFPYGADPTGHHDSTNAIQNCITDAANNRGACVLPPGTYMIGSQNATPPWAGLTMPSESSLLGFQNLGDASPSLVYYGTGTAITIGNCYNTSHVVYGVNLVNVAVNAADPNPNAGVSPPQYGIQSCGLSEANWDGLSVGNGSTKGYFTGANIRFYDSAEIDLLNLTVGNPAPPNPYLPGTTGILFDDVGPSGGNATITIHGGLSAFYRFQNAIVCKSCINLSVRDSFFEANDYVLFVDNSTWTSSGDGLANVHFESTNFLVNNLSGPTHNKVLQVNSPEGATLRVQNLVFRSTKWQLNGGVTYPVELNIPKTGQYSVFSLKLDTNLMDGVGMAVVHSNNPIASIVFTGQNDILDNSGTVTGKPTDVDGAATVTDYPLALNVLTEIGANTAIASRASASNPALGFGLTVTVPLGHSIQAGPNTFAYGMPMTCGNSNPMTCTSTSAPANGSTVLISGLTGGWMGANGTYAATNTNPGGAGGTTFSIPVDSSAFGPFPTGNPGWGNVIPIKSSFNVANNIAAGYANTGTIVLFYNGSVWQDLKQ
jgi:hypothetical protein